MADGVDSMTEAQLAKLVEPRLREWFPAMTACWRSVRLGNYTLDYLIEEGGTADRTGDLVVLELKVDMHHRALGQLLLYRHALQKQAGPNRKVRSALITTFLDRNVAEIAHMLGEMAGIKIDLMIAVQKGDAFELVAPSADDARRQVWDQAQDATRGSDLKLSGEKLVVSARSCTPPPPT